MGRIERVFRTFKETVFDRFWLLASIRQLDRFCADFLPWHNRDRPHGGWDGRTPDEVFLGLPLLYEFTRSSPGRRREPAGAPVAGARLFVAGQLMAAPLHDLARRERST